MLGLAQGETFLQVQVMQNEIVALNYDRILSYL